MRTNDVIRKTPEGYVIYSHKGKKLSKPYKNKEDAEKRLKEIEMFKHMKDEYKVIYDTIWVYVIDMYNGSKWDQELDVINGSITDTIKAYRDMLGRGYRIEYVGPGKTHKNTNGRPVQLSLFEDSINNELNDKIWDKNKELKKPIRKKIEQIVDKFCNTLEEHEIEIAVKDVIIIGSNASYNYTNKSDLDVHIIVNEPDENMMKLYDAYKTLFNENHKIDLDNIRVEIYVQNSIDDLKSMGIYSLSRGWIKIPTKEDIVEYNTDKEFISLEKEYNKVIKSNNVDKIDKLLDKVYALRKEGFEKDGENSKENQIFKKFREKGYIDKLKTMKLIIESENLSL